MAAIAFSLRAPQCMACMRRAIVNFNDAWCAPSRQQLRGKKKLAKATTIKVRLLADIPRYGRQGAIIPIAPGRMRNDFYPKKMAEYMTTAQLRDLGIENTVFERDSTFGTAQPHSAAQQEDEAEAPRLFELESLNPDRAIDTLEKLIPVAIDFYRTPIAIIPPEPERHSPSIPTTSAVSAAAQKAKHKVEKDRQPKRTSIYGSVTTTDIAANLRAILTEDTDGSRIVLSPEDISFIEKSEEKDRVKHLGIFQIQITVKGTTSLVRRTVIVNPQSGGPEESAPL